MVCSKKNKKLLDELTRAVKDCEIPSCIENLYLKDFYGINCSFLILSKEVIEWFLLKGKILPDTLQEELCLFQLPRPLKRANDTVRIQVVGQYLIEKGEQKNVTHLLNHDLMKKYGTKLPQNKADRSTSHRRALNKLFDSRGKRGRPTPLSEKDGRQYSRKSIPEVMRKDHLEDIRYDIPLLKTVMITLSLLAIEDIGSPQLFSLTQDQFLMKLFNHEVVKLYLKGSSKYVINLIETFCLEAVRILYPRPKIQKPISALLRSHFFPFVPPREICFGFCKNKLTKKPSR